MDFTFPAIGQNYSSGYTAAVIANQKDIAKWLDSTDVPSPTGLVANIKRYNATNQLFERRNAGNTAWEELPLAYAKLASPIFTGNPEAPTQAADNSSTRLATTAFVVGQAGSSNPLMNGTVAVGTSLRYSRQDHVHPVDTSRAPLASPNFSGTPLVGGNIIYHQGNFDPATKANLSGATFTGRVVSKSDSQTGYSSSALESYCDVGNALFTLHAAGSTAAVIQHLRGGSGIRIFDASMSAAPVYASFFQQFSLRSGKTQIRPMAPGALDRVRRWKLYDYEYRAQRGVPQSGPMADEADARICNGEALNLLAMVAELAGAVQEMAGAR